MNHIKRIGSAFIVISTTLIWPFAIA